MIFRTYIVDHSLWIHQAVILLSGRCHSFSGRHNVYAFSCNASFSEAISHARVSQQMLLLNFCEGATALRGVCSPNQGGVLHTIKGLSRAKDFAYCLENCTAPFVSPIGSDCHLKCNVVTGDTTQGNPTSRSLGFYPCTFDHLRAFNV